MINDDEVTLVPTSSMSFEKHVLIIRAYVVLSRNGEEQVHYKTVMRQTGLGRTQISGVNSFFVGLGFLMRRGKGEYIPVEAVVDFVGNRPGDENYTKLVPVIADSPQYRLIEGLLRIHGKLSKIEAIEYLLNESGEKTESRAERVLDWLEKVGLILINQEGDIEIQEIGGQNQ